MFNPALFSAFCFVAKPNSNGYTLSSQPTPIFLLNVQSKSAQRTWLHCEESRGWCHAGSPVVPSSLGLGFPPTLCSRPKGDLRSGLCFLTLLVFLGSTPSRGPSLLDPLTLQGAVVRVEWPRGSGEGGPLVHWQSGGGGVWQSWESLVIWWHRQMAEVVQAMHGAVHGRGFGAGGLTSFLPRPLLTGVHLQG